MIIRKRVGGKILFAVDERRGGVRLAVNAFVIIPDGIAQHVNGRNGQTALAFGFDKLKNFFVIQIGRGSVLAILKEFDEMVRVIAHRLAAVAFALKLSGVCRRQSVVVGIGKVRQGLVHLQVLR